MQIDYNKLDEELDNEILAMYKQDDESESESDSPAETGTESQETETQTQSSEQVVDETTLVNDTNTQDTKETVDADRYHNAVKAMNKAQQEAAELRKQFASQDAVNQQYQEQIQQLQAQLQQLQESKAPPEEASTPETLDDDELKEAREIYPEVVNPLLKIINDLQKKLSDEISGVKSEVGNVKGVADRYQQAEAKTAEQLYWDAIKGKHDDVDDLPSDPTYIEWYHKQAPLIKQALTQGTANDVIAALDLYRAVHPKTVPEQEVESKPTAKPDKLAAAKEAAAPSIKGNNKPEQKRTFTDAQIQKMSIEEYTKYEKEIEEAISRGEVY
jgi:hypothetical protein